MACITTDISSIIVPGTIGQTQTFQVVVTKTDNSNFTNGERIEFFASLNAGVNYNPLNAVVGFSGLSSYTFSSSVSSYTYTFQYTNQPTSLNGAFKIEYYDGPTLCTRVIPMQNLYAFEFCTKRTGCHGWKIEVNGTVDFDYSVIDSFTNIVASGNQSSLDFALVKDGIYTIEVVVSDTITLRKTLIDFCDLFACVENMINFIFCKTVSHLTVGDPCYSSRAPEECFEKQKDKYRNELNKIMAAYLTLLMLLNKAGIEYLGFTCIADNQRKDYAEIMRVYDSLSKLVKDCGGKCAGSNTPLFSSPCKTC